MKSWTYKLSKMEQKHFEEAVMEKEFIKIINEGDWCRIEPEELIGDGEALFKPEHVSYK